MTATPFPRRWPELGDRRGWPAFEHRRRYLAALTRVNERVRRWNR